MDVVSPFETARTRIVDAISTFLSLRSGRPPQPPKHDFGCAVELFTAPPPPRPCWSSVAHHQVHGDCTPPSAGTGSARWSSASASVQMDGAVLGNFRGIESDLVGSTDFLQIGVRSVFCAKASANFWRHRLPALARDRRRHACSLIGLLLALYCCHYQQVYRKSTTLLISCSVRMRFRTERQHQHQRIALGLSPR